MEIFNKKILLCSHSPRRKQILLQMGFALKVVSCDCEETYPDNLSPEQVAMYLARKKGQAYREKIAENEILLTADTIVVLPNAQDSELYAILGKPKTQQEAYNMLKNLSDKEHFVITGCYLRTNEREDNFFEKTLVRFAPLSDDEITYYVRTMNPLDKAGAYGIQEWIGMTGISQIRGDYYNVMGLPAQKLWQKIKEI